MDTRAKTTDLRPDGVLQQIYEHKHGALLRRTYQAISRAVTTDQQAVGCFNKYMTWSTAPTNIFRPLTWCFYKYMTCLTETYRLSLVLVMAATPRAFAPCATARPSRTSTGTNGVSPRGICPNKHPARPAFMPIRAWCIPCVMQYSLEKQQ